MKLKNLSFMLVLIFLLVGCVAVPSTDPPTALGQALVALPEEATLLIASLLTAALTFLLAKINMGALTQPIVAAVAPVIIMFAERLLQTIPPVFDNLVLSIIHVIVLFLTSLGTYIAFKKAKQPTTLLQ